MASNSPLSTFGRQGNVPSGVKAPSVTITWMWGVIVDQLAESLDTGHHARFHIGAAKHLPVDFSDGQPSGPGQSAEQAAVVAAVDPQAFGDGKDKLPMGNGGTVRWPMIDGFRAGAK